MGKLAEIWRYPLKSHGRESLEHIEVRQGEALPFDRRWAIRHERSGYDSTHPAWAPCANFMRGSLMSELPAIDADFDEVGRKITLHYPETASITIALDQEDDQARLLEWLKPLMAAYHLEGVEIVELPARGFTDTDYPSISLMNFASHQDLEKKLGRELSTKRWRGNFWIEGLKPWQEFDWIGKTLRIGSAEFEVVERIKRCQMTSSNPATGKRDLDMPKALRAHYGHDDFGVYLRAKNGGALSLGMEVAVS